MTQQEQEVADMLLEDISDATGDKEVYQAVDRYHKFCEAAALRAGKPCGCKKEAKE